MSVWLGVQEDRGDGLRDTVIKKKEELARLEEIEEDDFRGPTAFHYAALTPAQTVG